MEILGTTIKNAHDIMQGKKIKVESQFYDYLLVYFESLGVELKVKKEGSYYWLSK